MTIAAIIPLLNRWLACSEIGVEVPVREVVGEVRDDEAVADEDGFVAEIIESSKDWELDVSEVFEIAVKVIAIMECFTLVGSWPDNTNVGGSKDSHDSAGVKFATMYASEELVR